MGGMKTKWGKRIGAWFLAILVLALGSMEGITVYAADIAGGTGTAQEASAGAAIADVSPMMADGMVYQDTIGSFGRSGRWFKKKVSGGKYYFTNTGGSAIYFKVTGSKNVNIDFVSQVAAATPYFAYSVDGKAMKRQLVSKKKISVGDKGTHYVRLVIDAFSESENKWNEAGVGIKSIKPAASTGVVTGVEPVNGTIAFYGDSITEGIRAVGMDLSPSGTSATSSYAWYCAKNLGLVPYYAGYGGSGIIKTGSFQTCYNAVQSFSGKTKAKEFDADVIVVEHGTNDVGVSSAAFISEYKRVLKKLHKAHPQAKIMAMIPLNQIHADEIRTAASGFSYCTVVETSSWKISCRDGLHPTKSGGKTMGKKLAKKIRTVWEEDEQ